MEIENQEQDQDQDQDVAQPEENKASEQPGWFQEFVDHYDVDKPQQGEMLKGTILDIQDSSILLDVGLKRDAIIPGQDLDKVDADYLSGLEVGDEITVAVIRTPLGDDDLLVSLQRGLAQKTWIKAEELAEQDALVELKVVDQNRGGLLVSFDNLQAFVPNSHIPSIRRGTSTHKAGEIKAELIGKTLPLKVIEVNQKDRKLVFSARAAQREQRVKRLKELEVGQVIQSRVVNVVDFGVFVDLDGVDGLVHKSEIDWERVTHPSKWFKVGDEIEVKVVSIDIERERVSLSRKQLLPNPWETLVEELETGDLVEGEVVSVLDFGAFVEVREGLHGLVHVSEIGYASTEDPKSVVRKGDQVLVKIIGIEKARERISLSMRRVPLSEQMEWIMKQEEEGEDGESAAGGEASEKPQEGGQAEESLEQETQDQTEEQASPPEDEALAEGETGPADQPSVDSENESTTSEGAPDEEAQALPKDPNLEDASELSTADADQSGAP